MQKWTEPLARDSYKDKRESPHWVAENGRVPKDMVVRCTENVSVEMETMPFLIQHIDRYVRQFLSREKALVLFLDGHTSIKCMQWIEESVQRNIEVIVLPANTTHFCSLATMRETSPSSAQYVKR